MLNYLKEVNFTDKDIEYIESNIQPSDLYTLSINENNVINIIEFLQKINIDNIPDIIVKRTDIFFKSFKYFLAVISTLDIKTVIDKFNSGDFDIDI